MRYSVILKKYRNRFPSLEGRGLRGGWAGRTGRPGRTVPPWRDCAIYRRGRLYYQSQRTPLDCRIALPLRAVIWGVIKTRL